MAIGYSKSPSALEISDYYQKAKDSTSLHKKAMGGTDHNVANSILRAVGWMGDPGPTLEIGAGEGLMTDVLVAGPCPITVVEPFADVDFSSKGAAYYRDIDSIPESNRYDWILMIEVIEHLDDPVGFLAKVGKRLTERGRLVVSTPNAAGPRARLQGQSWSEVQNITHLNLFSPLALRTALTKAGFKQIERSRSPVAYKNSTMANAILGFTQLLGIDGGIRMTASNWQPTQRS